MAAKPPSRPHLPRTGNVQLCCTGRPMAVRDVAPLSRNRPQVKLPDPAGSRGAPPHLGYSAASASGTERRRTEPTE